MSVCVCVSVSVSVSASVSVSVCVSIFRPSKQLSAQICPKMDLALEIEKTDVRIRISNLKILCHFSAKMGNFDFFGLNLPQNGSE